MDLKMFIGPQLIDVININQYQFDKPGYIQFLKTEMEEKNADIIDLRKEKPDFFIDNVPSSMNKAHLSLLERN
jgi:hypothetical protein